MARYAVGIDEAGYGPLLGPLVIAASLWKLPEESEPRGAGSAAELEQTTGSPAQDIVPPAQATGPERLYTLLGEWVVARGPRARATEHRVALGDSKALYQSGRGLGTLETSLWAALAAIDSAPLPTTWRAAWPRLAPEAVAALAEEPWLGEVDPPWPLAADRQAIDRASATLRQGFQASGARLLGVYSRVVFAAEWNELLTRHGTKGQALSYESLALLARVVEPLAGSVEVMCDKHGGRNRYQSLLQAHVGEALVEVHGESSRESVYRWGAPQRRREVRFRPRGESVLPTALASMAAKYLRELAMHGFNAFWRSHLPDLRPTAGYYTDAQRFRREISAKQAELGIDDARLWRVR